MIFIDAISEQEPYCVYHHLLQGAVFYVGSGVLSRAFDHGSARRNEAWNQHVADIGYPFVSVEIVHRCVERAEARRVEYEHIRKLRPIANLPYQRDRPLDAEIRYDRGKPVFTDAYEGKVIRMNPDNRIFASLEYASKATGISKSAISNSISHRYREVAGKTFDRIAPAKFIPIASTVLR